MIRTYLLIAGLTLTQAMAAAAGYQGSCQTMRASLQAIVR
jgi:hypothetical protein